MESIGLKGKGFGMSFYTVDKNNPYELAYAICDWCRRIKDHDIIEVVDELSTKGCLNELGEKVLKAISFTLGRGATNIGIPKEHLKFFQDYFKWKEKNLELDDKDKKRIAELKKVEEHYNAIEVKGT